MIEMPKTRNKQEIIESIKHIGLATIVIVILGYIDYITGEMSLDILYIICLCAVTWYTSIFIGVLCIIEIIFAKTTADYYDQIKIGTHLYEWNTFSYLFMYLVVSVIPACAVTTLKTRSL